MVFVSMTHRIDPDDITPVGTDRFLTAERVRELTRTAGLGAESAGEGVVWIVRDEYLRTLGPVEAGEQLSILGSFENADPSPSIFRLCARVIGANGVAVACAYQTLECRAPTGGPAALPRAVRERRDAHAEPHVGGSPSFAERAVVGDVAALFPRDVLELGARVATHGAEQPQDALADPAPRASVTRASVTRGSVTGGGALRSSVIFRASMTLRRESVSDRPRASRTSSALAPIGSRMSGLLRPVPEFVAPVIAEHGVAFVFPGAGAYDGELLRELHASLPYLASYVEQADIHARRHLRASFFRLVDADSIEEHDEHLRRTPELAQLGVLLTGVLFAEALQERGVRPDVLVGHGLGELAALTVAGAFTVDVALQIVVQRILALRSIQGDAVPEVVPPEIAARFERALTRLKLGAPRVQVYSPIDRALYMTDTPVSAQLASHLFLREPEFAEAVRVLHRAGCEYFVECGTGGLTRFVGESITGASMPATAGERKRLAAKLAAATNALAQRPARSISDGDDDTEPSPLADTLAPAPVAVIGMGCMMPGASDAEAYWANVVGGASAIGEHETISSEAWSAAGMAEPSTVAWGGVDDVAYDPRLPFTADEYGRLSRTQRLIAHAMQQCVAKLRVRPVEAARVRFILGASAEGMGEYEERVLMARVRELAESLDEPPSLRELLVSGLDELSDARGDNDAPGPSAAVAAVVERFVGAPVDVVLVDAACASSLYAVDLAMKSLRTMDVDLAIVGGVFSPGASWQPLYSLFEGQLGSTATPFDARADGVVFGEGVTLLSLKRLRDAMDGGERIHAVIRAVGLSSDGKKASVGDPSAVGQTLAMRRAYANATTEPHTVQLVEGHGTSNAAADATEVDALGTVLGDSESTLAPRVLGSVKAIVGHSVWAAGAASVAKVCRALEEHVVPPQSDVASATPTATLDAGGFQVLAEPRSWPPNADGEPRRAGVSAFGLGGTNAHAVLEAMSPIYHQRLCERIRPEAPRARIAVVALSEQLDYSHDHPAMPTGLRAEVVEQLDVAQLLSAVGAERVLSSLPRWRDCRQRMGVVGGLAGRTARAQAASARVYRDELRRLLTTGHDELGLDRADAERMALALHERIGAATPAPTAHTLMGLLPNIAAARVANLMDLQGPNLVIDAGGRTLFEVLSAAERWLTCGTADAMLASVFRVGAGEFRQEIDGAATMMLTTLAFARKRDWPVLGEITLAAADGGTVTVQPGHATGAPVELGVLADRAGAGLEELARALDPKGSPPTVIRFRREERGVGTPRGRLTVPVRRPVVR